MPMVGQSATLLLHPAPARPRSGRRGVTARRSRARRRQAGGTPPVGPGTDGYELALAIKRAIEAGEPNAIIKCIAAAEPRVRGIEGRRPGPRGAAARRGRRKGATAADSAVRRHAQDRGGDGRWRGRVGPGRAARRRPRAGARGRGRLANLHWAATECAARVFAATNSLRADRSRRRWRLPHRRLRRPDGDQRPAAPGDAYERARGGGRHPRAAPRLALAGTSAGDARDDKEGRRSNRPLQLMHVERTPSGFAVARAGYERMSEWIDEAVSRPTTQAGRGGPGGAGHADRASLRDD